MSNPSISSKIMDLVCSALIAPPSKIGMPKDFYYRIEDRQMPVPAADDWKQQRDRLFVNLTRRKMVARLAVMASAINGPIILLFLVLYFIL